MALTTNHLISLCITEFSTLALTTVFFKGGERKEYSPQAKTFFHIYVQALSAKANVSPIIYVKQLQCQATSCSMERSFSVLDKLKAKDGHFAQDNLWKYLAELTVYANKSSKY